MKPACVRVGYGEPTLKVSIVALLCDFAERRAREFVVNCIKSIRLTAPCNAEIILVANDPSDVLYHLIKEAAAADERVIPIVLGRNLGVVAKNLAYEVAQGKYIFSIDGDVEVHSPTAFLKCMSWLDEHPETGLVAPCGGLIVKQYWTPRLWCIGTWTEHKTAFGYEHPTNYGTHVEDDGALIDSAPSLFWCFRRSLIKEVGPLDWRYGPFVGSDTDFCFRVKEAGHKINIISVPIIHAKGGGVSHEKIEGLNSLRIMHMKALYDDWFHKADMISDIDHSLEFRPLEVVFSGRVCVDGIEMRDGVFIPNGEPIPEDSLMPSGYYLKDGKLTEETEEETAATYAAARYAEKVAAAEEVKKKKEE